MRESSTSVVLKSKYDKVYEGLQADCFVNFLNAHNLEKYYRREDVGVKAHFNFIGHAAETDGKVFEFIRTFQFFKESVELP